MTEHDGDRADPTPVAGEPQTEAGQHIVDASREWYLSNGEPVRWRDVAREVVRAEAEARRLTVERLLKAMRDHCHDSADEGPPIYLRHAHLAPFIRDDCGTAIVAALAHPEEEQSDE